MLRSSQICIKTSPSRMQRASLRISIHNCRLWLINWCLLRLLDSGTDHTFIHSLLSSFSCIKQPQIEINIFRDRSWKCLKERNLKLCIEIAFDCCELTSVSPWSYEDKFDRFWCTFSRYSSNFMWKFQDFFEYLKFHQVYAQNQFYFQICVL